MKKHKCECPYNSPYVLDECMYEDEEKIAMVHEPNKCLETYKLREYKREGKSIWLCSACNMPGDILV